MNLIKIISGISELKWKNIETDKSRNSNNIVTLRTIRDAILDLNKQINKRIKSSSDYDSEHESSLNLAPCRHYVTQLDAYTSSIDYKLFKDNVGLRSLVLSISDITSNPSLPAPASKLNTLSGLTQHYVSTAETYYNTKNANIKQPQSSHINYYQALETIDRSFVFLLDALLENKEKYLDVYQNLELFKILSFYTTLVLHNDIEVLKTISQDSSNLLLNPMTTTEYIRTRLPELKEEIGELVNHYAETKKKYEYNNIFGIGYSQQEKFSALNKLYTLIGKKQTNYNYDTSSSIFKLDEKDKCILKNGKTGQKLESLAARYGLLSLDNLLALL